MENKKPRIGIYGSVPKDNEAFKVITSILGYDPYEVKEIEQDQIIASVCGRAKTFGAHFTIYDIFTPTDYPALIEKLKEILSEFKPFDFTFVRFEGYVRGDHQGKTVYDTAMKTVVALDFDSDSVAKFNELHKTIIENIQNLRAKIEPEFDKELFRKVPELWALIEKYGAPYVLKNYSPHLTLASGLDGSDETCNRIISYLNENYSSQLLHKQIPFDAVYIFEEILGGEFNGYFRIKETIYL